MGRHERKNADRAIRAKDKARDLESGLWQLGVQLAGFVKQPSNALMYDHHAVKGGQLYTTNIPASSMDNLEVLVSPRGHIQVFGLCGAVVFSSVFNKYGSKKAVDIIAEGVRQARHAGPKF